MENEIKQKLFLNNLQKIENRFKGKFKQDINLINCIKISFTIVTTLLLVFMVFPAMMGYSLGTIEPRSNSMKDSLGNIGVGYYKNYKSPVFASVRLGNYTSGEDSSIYYDVSEVKKEVRMGDIIIFNKKGFEVIHQVIEISDYGVITKGTNNIYEDDLLDYEEIKGKLVFWWRIW